MRVYISLVFVLGLLLTGCTAPKVEVAKSEKAYINPKVFKDKITLKLFYNLHAIGNYKVSYIRGFNKYMNQNFPSINLTNKNIQTILNSSLQTISSPIDLELNLKYKSSSNMLGDMTFYITSALVKVDDIYDNDINISFSSKDNEKVFPKEFVLDSKIKNYDSEFYNLGFLSAKYFLREIMTNPNTYNRMILNTYKHQKRIYSNLLKKNSIDRYTQFLKYFPLSGYYDKVERKLYTKLLKKNNLKEYETFLKNFPKSNYKKRIFNKMLYLKY